MRLLGQRQRPWWLMALQAMWALSCCHLPFTLSPQVLWRQNGAATLVAAHTQWGLHLSQGTLSLGNLNLFVIKRLQQTWPTFALEWSIIIIILGNRQTLPLLQMKTLFLSVFSKALCSTNIFGKIHLTQSFQSLCSEDVQKYGRLMENCLPTILVGFYRQHLCARHDTSFCCCC